MPGGDISDSQKRENLTNFLVASEGNTNQGAALQPEIHSHFPGFNRVLHAAHAALDLLPAQDQPDPAGFGEIPNEKPLSPGEG